MKTFGIIASSVLFAYSILTFILMIIDQRHKRKNKNPMKDFKFLLEVQVTQNLAATSGKNPNVLVYSPELLANQIIPKPNTFS